MPTSFAQPANNVSTFVGPLGYTAGTGVLTLAPGGGAKFPALAPGAWYRVTVVEALYAYSPLATKNNYTIFDVTAVAGDALALGGPIEGTTDRPYAAGDVVEVRVTAGTIGDLQAATNALESGATPTNAGQLRGVGVATATPADGQALVYSASTGDWTPTTAVGPAGPQGPQGPQGPVGATGTQGPKGDTGATGPQGTQGPAGPQGPQGVAGTDGAAGPQGATGPQGPAGADGATGPQGATGAVGPQGPAGTDGATGPQGPAGATGPAGPGLPVGGTTGQFPMKASGTDYNTTWHTLTTSDVSGLGTAATHAATDFQAAGNYVTSVALSLPSIFTVSGSPVTASGTLAATLASQAAATVFAAPAGAAGAPAFRPLVASDIPGLDGTKITSGSIDLAAGTHVRAPMLEAYDAVNAADHTVLTHVDDGGLGQFPRAHFDVYGNGSDTNAGLFVTPGNAFGGPQIPTFLALSTARDNTNAASRQFFFYMTPTAAYMGTQIATGTSSSAPGADIYLGGGHFDGTDSPVHIDTAGRTTVKAISAANAALTVQGAPSQAGPLATFNVNGGASVLTVNPDGSLKLPTLADTAAANGSLYFSSTVSKLTYKDSTGTLHQV